MIKRILFNERGCFGGGSSPQPVEQPKPSPQAAQGDITAAGDAARRRRRAAASSTILTSPLGVTTGGSTTPLGV